MKRSTERILTTHAGSLPLPPELKEMLVARNSGQPYDKEALAKRVRETVLEVVKKQIACGLDVINDGEVGKPNFSRYARERLSGFVERPAKPDERASTIGAVRKEARRLNGILSDFLHFARPPAARRAPGDIREVVEHVSALIRDDRSRASRVDVRVAVDPAVPRFAFDRDQVIQVLWNVALNGVEAMNGRGRLSLEVARQNGDVALAISDTGPGISPENLPRVFEPFYSGKPNGSGLGLTIAERIVGAHGGRIEIDSRPGRGTRVTLLFPLEAA